MIRGTHHLKYYTNILNRFYNQQTQHIIHNEPEEELFTLFLNKHTPTPQSPTSIPHPQPNPLFKLSRSQYLHFADSNPLGSIVQLSHKGLDLTLLSTSFSSSDIPGMYKSIQKIKPDLVLVQVRPDLLLSDFDLVPKKKGVFSDRQYFKQLLRSPFEVMPSFQMREYVSKKIRGRVTLRDIPSHYLSEYSSKLELSKQYHSFISKQFINNYVIGTSAYYCERNNIDMVLCGLPEISQRQILANQSSLMELQVMFQRASEQLALYSKVTPRKTANFLFPEVFLNPSDNYMFMLIEFIAALKKYKRVLVLTGVMENQGTKEYLENKTMGTILESILPSPPEGSILREIDNFEVIEKHCLLDVMEFGEQILVTPMEELGTTQKVSQFYADPHYTDQGNRERVWKFRSEMYKKYLSVMQESRKVGEQLKTKDWIRRALES